MRLRREIEMRLIANQTLLTNRASVEKGGQQYNSDDGNLDGGIQSLT